MANTKYFNIQSSFSRNELLTLLTVFDVKTFNIYFRYSPHNNLITVAVWKAGYYTFDERNNSCPCTWLKKHSWVGVLRWQKWISSEIKNVPIRKLSALTIQSWLKAFSVFICTERSFFFFLFLLSGKTIKKKIVTLTFELEFSWSSLPYFVRLWNEINWIPISQLRICM